MQPMLDSEITMLTDELVLSVLVTALRLEFPLAHRPDAIGRRMRVADAAPALTPILNALPRSFAPELSYFTLLLMPWIDSDTAARHGDIWLLDTMHSKLVRAPWNRPVQYTLPDVLAQAGGQGHVHVLNWWELHVGLPRDLATGVLPACNNGHLRVVEWWLARFSLTNLQLYFDEAAQSAHLDIMQMLWQKSVEQGSGWIVLSWSTMAHVVRFKGRPDLLKWCLERLNDTEDCRFDELQDALVVATVVGNKEAVRLLVTEYGQLPQFTADVAAFACATGDLEYVKWCQALLVQSGCRSQLSPFAYVASAFGHVHVLDWLEENAVKSGGLQSPVPESGWNKVLADAYPAELDPLLPALRDECLLISSSPVLAACASGHIPVLEWWISEARKHTIRVTLQTIRSQATRLACRFGHVHVLKWLHDAGINDLQDEDVVQGYLHNASVKGHVDVLRWLQSNCDSQVWQSLASKDHGRWFARPLRSGNDAIALWWLESGIVMDPLTYWNEIAIDAAQRGCPGVLKWWLNHPEFAPPTLDEGILDGASYSCRCETLDLLLEHNKQSPGFLPSASNAPAELRETAGKFQLFDWLLFWVQSGLALKPLISCHSRCFGPQEGLLNVLFVDAYFKLGLLTGPMELDPFSADEDVPILDWAVRQQSKLQLSFSKEFLFAATANGSLLVLEWWKRSPQIAIKFTSADVLSVCIKPFVKQWWEQSGLLPNDRE